MSRVIKFRAWDKDKNEFWPQDQMEGIGGFYYNQGVEPEEQYELMQYTGLQDKNGVEIYEDDIVRCTKGCPHRVGWFEDNGGTFIGGMPGFNLEGLIRNSGKGYAWDGTEEVIGNIYENPGLLGGKR